LLSLPLLQWLSFVEGLITSNEKPRAGVDLPEVIEADLQNSMVLS